MGEAGAAPGDISNCGDVHGAGRRIVYRVGSRILELFAIVGWSMNQSGFADGPGVATAVGPDSVRSGSACCDPGVGLLELLEDDPFVGSLVVGEDGRVERIDQAASEMLMRGDARFIARRPFDGVLSPRLAGSIRANLQPEPTLMRAVVEGWQVVLVARRSEGDGFTMIMQRRGGIIPARVNDFLVRFLPCGSLGSLGLLSNREIEVASLIGMGMSVREIAEHLHRSVKTIENHRVSIGRKLGVSGRLDIALLAHKAGLRPEDVHLQRL
jgi:DNA-binding CsgD family transcriptional regulator